jgi:hypothetical protein
MLEPQGALALIVHSGAAGRPKPPSPGPPPIPHDELNALVEKYLGPRRRAGQGFAAETERYADVLVRTRFGQPKLVIAPGIPDLLVDSESVLSFYFSTSYAAPHLFGDELDSFAGDARALLASRSPDGVFWNWPGDTEVILAGKG